MKPTSNATSRTHPRNKSVLGRWLNLHVYFWDSFTKFNKTFVVIFWTHLLRQTALAACVYCQGSWLLFAVHGFFWQRVTRLSLFCLELRSSDFQNSPPCCQNLPRFCPSYLLLHDVINRCVSFACRSSVTRLLTFSWGIQKIQDAPTQKMEPIQEGVNIDFSSPVNIDFSSPSSLRRSLLVKQHEHGFFTFFFFSPPIAYFFLYIRSSRYSS